MALNRHEALKSKFKLSCGFPNMFKVTKSTPGISEILRRKMTLRRYQSKERKTSNVSNDSEEDDKFGEDRNIDVDSKENSHCKDENAKEQEDSKEDENEASQRQGSPMPIQVLNIHHYHWLLMESSYFIEPK